jgi:hypothetical protein
MYTALPEHYDRIIALPDGRLCDNLLWTVLPSEARNLALSIFNTMRDSSSPSAPRNDSKSEFSHGLSEERLTRAGVFISRCGAGEGSVLKRLFSSLDGTGVASCVNSSS